MATIYEVAELAGVSLATVSRVINGNQNVSAKTRDKVKDAMNSLQYRPSNVAQSLASNRTQSIGLLLSEVDGPFFGELMGGVEEVLRKANKHLVITPGHFDVKQEQDGIDFLLSRGCDGLILAAEAVDDEYLVELSKKNVPFVVVGRDVAELPERCVCLDNIEGGYVAAKFVIAHGHKHIGYISGTYEKMHTVHRLQGHKKALKEAGIPFEESHVYYGDFKETGGIAGFQALMAERPEITAIICANDELAAGANGIAREMGYKVPEQISLVGYDNNVFTRYMHPKLTTVNHPIREMGAMATHKLLKDVYGIEPKELKYLFQPEVLARETVSKID